MNNRFIYSIGGHNEYSIERLDFFEKEEWEQVQIPSKMASINIHPCAGQISNNEILILCGNSTLEAGIWNILTNEVKRVKVIMKDSYIYKGTMHSIGRVIYATGSDYGHINYFDMKTRKFDGIDNTCYHDDEL